MRYVDQGMESYDILQRDSLPDKKVHLWDFSCGPVVKNPPSDAEDLDLIPDQGTEIPCASWPKNQNIKHWQYSNKCNKDFKNVYIKNLLKNKIKSILILKSIQANVCPCM